MEDFDLIKHAQDGNTTALAQLYDRYVDAIYRFCFWQTGRAKEVAEDLTQDVFLEMTKSIHKFKYKGSFKNWLYTIAKRKVTAWVREKYNLPQLPLFDTVQAAEDWIDPAEQEKKKIQAEKLLSLLEKTEEQVIRLRYLKTLSVRETASELSITETNVKVITHRALNKLKELAKNM